MKKLLPFTLAAALCGSALAATTPQSPQPDHREILYPPLVQPGTVETELHDVSVSDDGLVAAACFTEYTIAGRGGSALHSVTVFERQARMMAWTPTVVSTSSASMAMKVDFSGGDLFVASHNPLNLIGRLDVFTRQGGSWTPRTSNLVGAVESFGRDLDVSQDWVAVGGRSGADGIVYLYQQDPLNPANLLRRERIGLMGGDASLGESVALDRTTTGTTLAVGRSLINNNRLDAAIVYELTQVPNFNPSLGIITSILSISPVLSGLQPQILEFTSIDVDRDAGTLAIGAPRTEPQMQPRGRVYLYARDPSNNWLLADSVGNPTFETSSSSGPSQDFGVDLRFGGDGRMLVGSDRPEDSLSSFLFDIIPGDDATTPSIRRVSWLPHSNNGDAALDFVGDFAVTGAVDTPFQFGRPPIVVHHLAPSGGAAYATPCDSNLAPCDNESSEGCLNADGWAGMLTSGGMNSLQAASDPALPFKTLYFRGHEVQTDPPFVFLVADLGPPALPGLVLSRFTGVSSVNPRSVFLFPGMANFSCYSSVTREYCFKLDDSINSGMFQPMAGTTYSFQVMYRDARSSSSDPCTGRFINFSNSIEVMFED